ncbi:NUDIX hydrolase [Chitinimonas taiwanensis]|uniref:ADP-ribose pyrophosphatase YjhB, NUDIX family n=1 Tax=Chitinimonas taiwanensis DSM 18899 TaxID=1121279 RepID=A0A1K2H797_9NEIS|nr:NUDIX domain-containing protein [Chitinimonas taiwanensis]SFZ72370.1 ADP-ribose pyrophosphatase YjhB, NUDIX family [Chitinimonas taiwanensis DSM 18899]
MQTRYSARLIIVDGAGRLLLFLYQDEHQAPFWATPGGELKPGEDYAAAAARELYEETGLRLPIGPMLKQREADYAVARSVTARWQEQYYLVACPAPTTIFAADWTEEEQHTIQRWQWWDIEQLQQAPPGLFKPEWLPELLESLLTRPTTIA